MVLHSLILLSIVLKPGSLVHVTLWWTPPPPIECHVLFVRPLKVNLYFLCEAGEENVKTNYAKKLKKKKEVESKSQLTPLAKKKEKLDLFVFKMWKQIICYVFLPSELKTYFLLFYQIVIFWRSFLNFLTQVGRFKTD